MSTQRRQSIRVRFAPSPTGDLHLGSLRTALYNFLFARQNNGKFILRIEDTDQKRYVPKSALNIIKALEWAGLNWDEGPYLSLRSDKLKIKNEKLKIEDKDYQIMEKGKYSPYFQSKRLGIYQKYAQELIDQGKAYYCFCTEKELEEMREKQQKRGEPPMYDGRCRDLAEKQKKAKSKKQKAYVIRLKVPKNGLTEFDDLIRGKIVFENKTIDDQVLLKSDGFPTYHLAVVVDDHLMKITHVIRAEEWLSSTPKHILLYQAFGFKPPKFAHLPLILAPDRSKLSKRHGAISILALREQGYLKEALINFMALLGWNPDTDQEIFSLDELVKSFSLDKVQKAAAIFNQEKLDFLNGWYIRQMDLDKFTRTCLPYLKDEAQTFRFDYIKSAVGLEQERMKKLSEISYLTEFFFKEPKYETRLLIWKKADKKITLEKLKFLLHFLSKIPEKNWTRHTLEDSLKEIIEKENLGVGETLWPMRVALTGRKASPSPFEVAEVLEKEESLKRIGKAVERLK